ncbi:MAG TPA: pyridoxal-phosphate dependent enzyme [Nannocystaceae bacterium]|nr:pyridoxal-phosphate dependent enzyme [Nannocystaceae bacterium]
MHLRPPALAADPAAGPLAQRLARPPARLALATLPTPIERAPWLDGRRSEVWIKRDDRTSGLYGGGKVRKLEWVLANPPYRDDDDERGAAPIVSVGGTGSHHLVALALFLADLGRELHGLVFTQPWTPHVVRNFAVLVSKNARLWITRTRVGLPLQWLAYRSWRSPQRRGVDMGPGASTPLGCFGFVEAGLELAGQVAAGELPPPDDLYVACGSAGTAAGLALGLGLAGLRPRLHLVSSVEWWAFNRVLLDRKIAATWAALAHHGLIDPPREASSLLDGIELVVDHAEVGDGYGAPTPAGLFEVERARDHGLVLETTYTAKCVAALRRDGADADHPRTVLFWNTHGNNDLSPHIDPDWRARSPIDVPDL